MGGVSVKQFRDGVGGGVEDVLWITFILAS